MRLRALLSMILCVMLAIGLTLVSGWLMVPFAFGLAGQYLLRDRSLPWFVAWGSGLALGAFLLATRPGSLAGLVKGDLTILLVALMVGAFVDSGARSLLAFNAGLSGTATPVLEHR